MLDVGPYAHRALVRPAFSCKRGRPKAVVRPCMVRVRTASSSDNVNK